MKLFEILKMALKNISKLACNSLAFKSFQTLHLVAITEIIISTLKYWIILF
jgi:hypothetical protein